jgi:FkbM family methyltransferase
MIYKVLMSIRPAILADYLKKLLIIKRKLVKTKFGDYLVDPVSNFGQSLMNDNVYERELTDYFVTVLKKGDVFVDVGANEGYYSILASKIVGSNGKVFAIEPQSRLQSVLFNNIDANKSYNIKVFQTAIADCVGMAKINLTPDTNTGSSGIFHSTKYRNKTETIPQTTLSELFLLTNTRQVDMLKMDIEGFEYYAILGDKSVFENVKIKNIALEIHPTVIKRHNLNPNDIVDFLIEQGYKMNEDFIADKDVDETLLFSI